MKLLCARAACIGKGTIELTKDERYALRWAYVVAKRAGKAEGNTINWYHKLLNITIVFTAQLDGKVGVEVLP
jgi:hypothetical protein